MKKVMTEVQKQTLAEAKSGILRVYDSLPEDHPGRKHLLEASTAIMLAVDSDRGGW